MSNKPLKMAQTMTAWMDCRTFSVRRGCERGYKCRSIARDILLNEEAVKSMDFIKIYKQGNNIKIF
jgi:hypothetical protein